MQKSPKIVFFGSGPVAAKSLRLLLADFIIEAIITKPSTEREMRAIAPDILVYGVRNQQELDQLIDKKQFSSELGVLIDFGVIISSHTIGSFKSGVINSHFSILPEWRGADPISFAILSGQKQTGVSLMLVVSALDEGKLLTYSEYNIPESATGQEVTDDLIHLSYVLLKNTVPRYMADNTQVVDQSATGRQVSYSRKLTKQDGQLDFHKPAIQLEREIRAYIEWPKSYTHIAGKDVIISKAHVDPDTTEKPGVITKTINQEIAIGTVDGTLIIDELKPAGKSTMTAKAFLAGHGMNL